MLNLILFEFLQNLLPQNKPFQSPHKSHFTFALPPSSPIVTHFIPMSRRVLCKFFVRGACLKGEYCEFSHDWKEPLNNICTYYQKGACAYDGRCRFDHIIIPCLESCASFSPSFCGPLVSGIAPTPSVALGFFTTEIITGNSAPSELSTTSKTFTRSTKPARSPPSEHFHVVDDNDIVDLNIVRPFDRTLCSFANVGSCPRGEKCPHVHGDLCLTCGKHCLHPFRPEESEEHKRSCERRQKHLDALKYSQEIECSVCLERVLSKSTSAERKFGLLSECDHPFCISCIRNWRNNSPSSGMDINNALRACPICRKLSYFVVPSIIWYFSEDEKQEIIYNYKSKLKSIDCKYFDFGSGSCPFGTSCFYKHTYHDGRFEEVVPQNLEAADGNTIIAKERLPNAFSSLHIR